MLGIYESITKNNVHLVVCDHKEDVEEWLCNVSNSRSLYLFDPFCFFKVRKANIKIIRSKETIRNALHSLFSNQKFKDSIFFFSDTTQFLKCFDIRYSEVPVYVFSSVDMFSELLKKGAIKLDLKCKYIETDGYC